MHSGPSLPDPGLQVRVFAKRLCLLVGRADVYTFSGEANEMVSLTRQFFPVCDHYKSGFGERGRDAFKNIAFGSCVQSRSGFVQNKQSRLPQEQSSQGETLFFSS